MRMLFKIILFPIRLLLNIITFILTLILGISAAILNIFSVLAIVIAIASFIKGDIAIGIQSAVIAFLLSPYGIPMVGAVVIGFIGGINEVLKEI